MTTMASQITSLMVVYSTVYSDADQRETSKLRATGLCVGNSPGPVNSPPKGPVTRKMFPFDDVIMKYFGICRLEGAAISLMGGFNWNQTFFIPLRPVDVYMCQLTGSVLVQVMACCLFPVKPLLHTLLSCWKLSLAKFENECLSQHFCHICSNLNLSFSVLDKIYISWMSLIASNWNCGKNGSTHLHNFSFNY